MCWNKVEPVSELKNVVRKPQIYIRSPLYERAVTRKISVHVTWLLLHTDITANQVTLLQAVFGIVGFLFLCSPHTSMAFLGVLIIQFGFVLDCSDGEVARYRKSSSVNGVLFDFFNHVTVVPLITAGLGFHYQSVSDSPGLFYALVGLLGGLFSLSPLNTASSETILYLLENKKSPTYDYNQLRKGGAPFTAPGSPEIRKRGLPITWLRWIMTRWGTLARYPGSMNVISLFVLGELLFGASALGILQPAFVFYVFITVSRECFLLARSMRNHSLEDRYKKILQDALAGEKAPGLDS